MSRRKQQRDALPSWASPPLTPYLPPGGPPLESSSSSHLSWSARLLDRFRLLAILGVAIACPVLALTLLAIPPEHLTRCVSVTICLAFSFVLLNPRRSWVTRLGGFVMWLVLAAAAWLFLPAWGDVNLYMAWQETDQLEAEVREIRFGDQVRFDRHKERRQQLKGFPEVRNRLNVAENAWIEGTRAAIVALKEKLTGKRAELHELWRQNKYEEMDSANKKIYSEFAKPAYDLGQGEALRNFCDYYEGVVLLAKHAGKSKSSKN